MERRLVARQAKLSPKLHGRHAGCLAGHQIGRPKPYAQRRVRARHDRSHRQSGVTAALAAAQDARTICEAERLSRRLTMGANKPVAPASLLQVGGAGRVVGKKSLELWERLWEPKIATLVNVHEHGRTLPLVAVGDNMIGKVVWNALLRQDSSRLKADGTRSRLPFLSLGPSPRAFPPAAVSPGSRAAPGWRYRASHSSPFRDNNSGSLAMLAAIRRASSCVSTLACRASFSSLRK